MSTRIAVLISLVVGIHAESACVDGVCAHGQDAAVDIQSDALLQLRHKANLSSSTGACPNKDAAELAMSIANDEMATATASKMAADTALSTADGNVKAAEGRKTTAEAALVEAKKALDAAEVEKTNAGMDLETAVSEKTTAEGDVNAAQDKVIAAQDKVDRAKGPLDGAKARCSQTFYVKFRTKGRDDCGYKGLDRNDAKFKILDRIGWPFDSHKHDMHFPSPGLNPDRALYSWEVPEDAASAWLKVDLPEPIEAKLFCMCQASEGKWCLDWAQVKSDAVEYQKMHGWQWNNDGCSNEKVSRNCDWPRCFSLVER